MLDCWKESRLVLENLDFSGISHVMEPDLISSVIIATLAGIVVVLFRWECVAVGLSFRTLFVGKKVREIENNQNYWHAVFATALICVPIFAVTVVKPEGGQTAFFIICGAMVMLSFVRRMLFSFASWRVGEKNVFKNIRRSLDVYLIIITILCLPLLVLRYTMSDFVTTIMEPYIFSVAGTVYGIYLIRSMKYLNECGFSHFFSFLYLCTLELLPTGLMISAYISL